MTQIKHTTQRHYQQLQPEERGEIQVLYEQGKSAHAIANHLHWTVSTIIRELKRGTVLQRNVDYQYYTRYFADSGQISYQNHRLHCHSKGLLKRCWFKSYESVLESKASIALFTTSRRFIQPPLSHQHRPFIAILIVGCYQSKMPTCLKSFVDESNVQESITNG